MSVKDLCNHSSTGLALIQICIWKGISQLVQIWFSVLKSLGSLLSRLAFSCLPFPLIQCSCSQSLPALQRSFFFNYNCFLGQLVFVCLSGMISPLWSPCITTDDLMFRFEDHIWALEQISQRGYGVSLAGNIPEQSGCNPVQCALGRPYFTMGVMLLNVCSLKSFSLKLLPTPDTCSLLSCYRL